MSPVDEEGMRAALTAHVRFCDVEVLRRLYDHVYPAQTTMAPERTVRILGKLELLWAKLPNWRLGALLSFLPPLHTGPLVGIPDEELEAVIDEVLQVGFDRAAGFDPEVT